MNATLRIAIQVESNRAHGRRLLEGIAAAALSHDNWRLEMVAPERLSDPAEVARFDGLVVRVMDDATERAILRARRPAVDTYGRSDSGPIPFVRLDDAAIAALAARCFAEHRFLRCAYCGFPGLRFSEARGRAFASAVARAGGTCAVYGGGAPMPETAVRGERYDRTADAAPLRRWVRSLPKPSAVFCCNDLRAYQLLVACAAERIGVPRELAVLGADNDTMLCMFSNPPLSSIENGPEEMGRRVVGMLAAQIAEPGAAPPESVRHAPRAVIERGSTDAFSVRTPWLSDALVFIRRRLGDGISAADVVRRVGYSHTTVDKVFRAELGTSVQREILRQRRERACRLLRETDRTAASIAAECGYPSAQYFAHRFAAHFGMTPDAWRKRAPDAGPGGAPAR